MKNIFLFITTFCYLALLSAIAGNIDVTVHLKNGDVITGKSTLAKVAVNTPYGALSIPTAQISTIKFGIFPIILKMVQCFLICQNYKL